MLFPSLKSLPKIFSAGLDIFELYQPKVDRLEKFWSEFQDLWLAIYSSPKTVMAAINVCFLQLTKKTIMNFLFLQGPFSSSRMYSCVVH